VHVGKEVFGTQYVARDRAGRAWLVWHVGSISPINMYLPIKIATQLVELY
jgi:hypothetical protein